MPSFSTLSLSDDLREQRFGRLSRTDVDFPSLNLNCSLFNRLAKLMLALEGLSFTSQDEGRDFPDEFYPKNQCTYRHRFIHYLRLHLPNRFGAPKIGHFPNKLQQNYLLYSVLPVMHVKLKF